MARKPLTCDLVLEGGGVKGIGLVGAIDTLVSSGYSFHRIAGTSAGAIVGSLIAAGMPMESLVQTMQKLDYQQFQDPSFLSRLGPLGQVASLLTTKGVNRGHYLRQWLGGELEKLGVRTFADLKLADTWASSLPPEQRYKLVVVASDITQGRMLRLPWDYHKYGLDPDKQLVAEAVRCSMSIPFFYQPAHLKRDDIVDGGILSDYPIDLFDNTPDWPTLGIKLSAKPRQDATLNPVHNIIDYAKAILATMANGHDQIHIDEPCTQRRTIFVDTGTLMATDFGITRAQQQQLFQNGQTAATNFLHTWDYAAYLKDCGTTPPAHP